MLLVVKKKDGLWRFCVDYRQINAIIVKDKHPLPVMDYYLMNWLVLNGSPSWIFNLVIIRFVWPGEEYKTTFRTHNGLFEFLVMPFGLTNAQPHFRAL